MSTFEVPILPIDDVRDHPNADRLSILKIRGYEAITNKLPDGSHRFQKGELVIYVPEGAVVPDHHLQERGYWNEKTDMGGLAGPRGDRVKALTLRGVLSQGLVWKTRGPVAYDPDVVIIKYGNAAEGIFPAGSAKVRAGEDVAAFFGITKFVPEVPKELQGSMIGLYENKFDFDIENLKRYPDLFVEGEEVVVTEKLHGILGRLSYLPDHEPDTQLFGDGRVTITGKGMGADGFTFIDVVENVENPYVQTLKPLADVFADFARTEYPGRTVHLIGEIFGPGVQDLHYGMTQKEFRAFDVVIAGAFLDEDRKNDFIAALNISRVPVLYEGPFSHEKIAELTSGDSTFWKMGKSANIREGVVITAAGDQEKRTLAEGTRLRPILKSVSEAYLTRKGGTEYQ